MPRWLKQHRWLVVVIIVPALFLLAQACSSSDNNASNTPVGKGGTVQAMPSYPVQVSGQDVPAQTIEVVASAGVPFLGGVARRQGRT